MTEAQLLTACLRNEPRAQTAFYEYFRKRVWALCRRYTRTSAEAEDVLQEVFIKLFKNLHKVEKPESLGGWVRQVAVRVAVDYYRANANQNRLVNLEDNSPEFEQQTALPPLVLDQLSHQDMLALIHALPDGYRMVMNLYIIDGYSHAEIAKMLNIKEVTSRSQLLRAKAAFRKAWEALEKKTPIVICNNN